MFGIDIPGWAIGVGVIILATSLGGAIKRMMAGDAPPRLPRGKPLSKRELGHLVEDVESKLSEVDELRSRLGELEDVQRRLSELEERVDFAERLLARPREAERLVPPKS
jgi:hypothetical protein